MGSVQEYRQVETPPRFDEWERNAKINYLQNAMDREQLANYVRSLHGIEQREQPLFRKDELAEIAVQYGGDA